MAASPLQTALEVLPTVKGVLQAGLAGDLLRAVTVQGVTADELQRALQEKGIGVRSVERTEPTLEDVFLSLAR
jgi:hypothetical protein